MAEEDCSGMKLFKLRPGTRRNDDNSIGRRRALTIGTDSDGWTGANVGLQRRGTPGGYNNWTLVRVFSKKLYSALEEHNKFGGEYFSAPNLADIFHEKLGEKELSNDMSFLGVEVYELSDLFKYGQTGIRLSIKGFVVPRTRENSLMSNVSLTANYELAELLKMVLKPGDILEIFGKYLPESSRVIHLNIKMSGDISIVHYRHNGVFNPVKESGLADTYNQIQDSRFRTAYYEYSQTEHRVEIKPIGSNKMLPVILVSGATNENTLLPLAIGGSISNSIKAFDDSEHREQSQSNLESQARNSQCGNHSTFAGVGGNLFSDDEFEQSNTSYPEKPTRKSNSYPCSGDSAGCLIQDLFREDNPICNLASRSNLKPVANDDGGTFDENNNSVPKRAEEGPQRPDTPEFQTEERGNKMHDSRDHKITDHVPETQYFSAECSRTLPSEKPRAAPISSNPAEDHLPAKSPTNYHRLFFW